MQNAFSAINNILRGKSPVEFVPLHDGPWKDTLEKWVLQGMSSEENGNAVDSVEHFGFDIAGCGGWFDCHPKFGDKLAFIGGLDARILESHDRVLIKKGVRGFICGMKERGARFVYGSDHSISTMVDYGDFIYSLEIYRENMFYR
jgi:hypothetical protein